MDKKANIEPGMLPDPSDPFAIVKPLAQAYEWLTFGEIRPAGWIAAQLRRDLEAGFLGHLDELVPELVQKDDIYGADRLTRAVRSKDLGVLAPLGDWHSELLWWNSETQSNWWDGLLRTTLLLEAEDFLPKVHAYIDRILATQDEDGYLGIYARDLRYQSIAENGELWAQAALLRGLLAYYEATREAGVLQAVKRAVQVTMKAYPMGGSNPFAVQNDSGGVGHGLVFTDVLDRLFQLTGERAFLEYALWLYRQYCQVPLSQADIQLENLLDPVRPFKDHGVHTYEHLRPLLTALYASGSPWLEKALQAYILKLDRCLVPSGGPLGDEFIGGREADATLTGYEYCSIHELCDSYSHLLQKTGSPAWAERIERLLFNAGQGARHPQESAVAYLKTDNSLAMTGPLNLDVQRPGEPAQTRYKYSPVHQDVAVCCVPNAGRIYPYYVKAMWMRTSHGLAALLYGPCEVQTMLNGSAVHISEETNYPFDFEIRFKITLARPQEFELSLRRPGWAVRFSLETPKGGLNYCEEDGLIKILRTWQDGDWLTLRFYADIRINLFQEREQYFSYGPLVFALPIQSQKNDGRAYPLEGFRDLLYTPESDLAGQGRLVIPASNGFRLECGSFEIDHPWDSSLALNGFLKDAASQRLIPVRLVPMGATILRKVTFPISPELRALKPAR